MEINPKVLVSDADKARISLRFLKDWGLSSADMNKIIHRDLRILSLSGDTSIQPALTFLESIGTSRDKIVELMILCPRIFHRGIGDRLIQKYDICQKLGINFHSAMRYIMLHRTERVFSQVEFFREQGFSDEDIVNLFEKEPRILAKSKGDLKVKLQFFTQIHNRSIAEIIKFPACLCYSFKNRILPRLTILKERGFPDKMNLFYILAVTDSAFRNICQTSDRISPH
ncbi:hypothetical protein KP509_31G027900 [Ceratopteris richardii]|nr:hypothetical protein KP509_31G027900 [Ceratopteris richardii]